MNYRPDWRTSAEEQKVRGWNGPLPFYMTHPGYLQTGQGEKVLRDMEYLQQMYPEKLKKLQRRISDMLGRMDYEGSMIFDEYPDYCSLRSLLESMCSVICNEEENPPAEELIQVLLVDEIYKRRNGKRKGYFDRLF